MSRRHKTSELSRRSKKESKRDAYLDCTGNLLKDFLELHIALLLLLVEQSDFLAEFSRIIGHCWVLFLVFASEDTLVTERGRWWVGELLFGSIWTHQHILIGKLHRNFIVRRRLTKRWSYVILFFKSIQKLTQESSDGRGRLGSQLFGTAGTSNALQESLSRFTRWTLSSGDAFAFQLNFN